MMRGDMGFDFSWRVRRAEMDKKQFAESIWSPAFATTNNGIRYVWALRLYPKGHKSQKFPSADQQPNVSLFLWLKEGSVKESVVAKYQLFVQGGAQMQKVPHTFDLCRGSGFPGFCRQKEIQTAEWVEVGARIWLKESAFDVDRLFPDTQLFRNINTNRLLYEQIVLGDKSQGSAKGDITIVVPDGTRLPCHQLFLRQASPIFHSMFQQPWVEGQEIRIDDIPLETLKQLLFFCYVDRMPKGWEDNTEGLLRAAHKYEMQKVVWKCEKKLAKRLGLENVMEMLSLALELNLKLLKMQTTQLLVDNWAQVSAADREKLSRDTILAVTDGLAQKIDVTALRV